MAVPSNPSGSNPSSPQPPSSRGRISASVQMESFEGPIPPPALLEAYERLVPGAAERLLGLTERQAAHRQDMERVVIRAGARDSLLGVILAGVIAVFAFAWSAYALSIGQTGEAVKGIVATILGFVATFVYGKRSTRLEREERARRSRPPANR